MTSAARAPWTRVITNNLGLKLVALGLSLLLFSLIHSDVDAQRSMFVDIVALLPPRDAERMLISELPTQVKVTLRGSRSRLSDLARDAFAPLQLDLREGTSGYYYFRAEDVDVPGGVQVVEIEPASIPLSWAPTARKTIPIHPHLEGKLGEHHRMPTAAVVSPAEAVVHGPKSIVDKLTTVSTEALSIEGVGTGAHTRRVALAPLPKLVNYEGEAYVEVHLDVEPIVAERVFKRLEVAVLGAQGGTLRPDRVSVTLRGPQAIMGELDPEHVVPYIELQGTVSAFSAHDVSVRGIPESVEVVRISPPSVLARGAAVRGNP